ncbi:MAG: dockerin type I domain-containing protein [Dehalococcoidia bacterium]
MSTTPTPTTAGGTPPDVDLALTMSDAPDPAPSGGALTYSIQVTNIGASPSPSVRLLFSAPAAFSYTGFSTSRGACAIVGAVAGGGLDCDLGPFGTGPAATAAVTVSGALLPIGDASIEATAAVDPFSVIAETNEANNSATANTTVYSGQASTATAAAPTATATATPVEPPASQPGLTGDVDCNDAVDSRDATLVLQYVAGLISSLACSENAHTNGDGTINAADAMLILQRQAGLLSRLPA